MVNQWQNNNSTAQAINLEVIVLEIWEVIQISNMHNSNKNKCNKNMMNNKCKNKWKCNNNKWNRTTSSKKKKNNQKLCLNNKKCQVNQLLSNNKKNQKLKSQLLQMKNLLSQRASQRLPLKKIKRPTNEIFVKSNDDTYMM